jgi:hypothetical protein
MEKEFIPYEQALALKELGFDEPCFGVYYISDEEHEVIKSFPPYVYSKNIGIYKKYNVLAPLYQQAFRWFREKYNLFCEIQIDRTTEPKFCFDIFQYEHFGNYEKIEVKEWYLYRTQEEAELECLKKLIEIVKEK